MANPGRRDLPNDADAEQMRRVLRAVGAESRRQLLLQIGRGASHVGSLALKTRYSQSTVRSHLKTLMNANLVCVDRAVRPHSWALDPSVRVKRRGKPVVIRIQLPDGQSIKLATQVTDG